MADLFSLAARVEKALRSAGIPYRVTGGLAAYLYVEEAEPGAGHLARDMDIAVRREDLQRIAEAVGPFGLEYQHTPRLDMLVQVGLPSDRRVVHMMVAGEKERPESLEPAPKLGPSCMIREIPLIPLADLVRMNLASFLVKDQTRLKELDEQGLITPEIEAALSPGLRHRLAQVRAYE